MAKLPVSEQPLLFEDLLVVEADESDAEGEEEEKFVLATNSNISTTATTADDIGDCQIELHNSETRLGLGLGFSHPKNKSNLDPKTQDPRVNILLN